MLIIHFNLKSFFIIVSANMCLKLVSSYFYNSKFFLHRITTQSDKTQDLFLNNQFILFLILNSFFFFIVLRNLRLCPCNRDFAPPCQTHGCTDFYSKLRNCSNFGTLPYLCQQTACCFVHQNNCLATHENNVTWWLFLL